MLRIKLSRRGKKKQPIFRILVMDRAKDPWGDFLENVGTWNPRTEPNSLTLKEERIKHWLEQGAKPTNTVHNLLVDAGIIKEKKVRASNLGKKYKEKVKAEAEAAKESEAKAKESTSAPEEAPAAKEVEAPTEEAPKEEAKPEEKKNETPAEEKKEEEPKAEEKKES